MARLPAAERKQQLLNKAAVLFARKGYTRTTTAQIARAAGITEPILYRHFRSKRALFIALIERTGDEVIRGWEKQLAGADSASQRIRILLGANPLTSNEGQGIYRVVVQGLTEIDDREIRKAIKEHMIRLHAFIVEQLKQAKKEKSLVAKADVELIAWMLMHLALGYGLLAPVGLIGHRSKVSGERIVRLLDRLLVR
ncbi:MAG TPA: TetR/AcrR family transcriptional regulator [Phycisphaeraceae bacterium]|nr:TetR/AcrR family transcriptional regulator [Phycisphaeraceae bacterium]